MQTLEMSMDISGVKLLSGKLAKLRISRPHIPSAASGFWRTFLYCRVAGRSCALAGGPVTRTLDTTWGQLPDADG